MPHSPILHLRMINANVLEIRWNKPFSRIGYPVLSYTIDILSEIGSVFLEHYQHNVSGTSEESFRYTRESVETECKQLIFLVSAVNPIGKSDTAEVHGGFPIGDYQLVQ